MESEPPEKIVDSSPLLTVAERAVTVVMNWSTEEEMREGRRLMVVRGEVNFDLSMPPKRTVPDVASGSGSVRWVGLEKDRFAPLTNIVQVDRIQAAFDLAT